MFEPRLKCGRPVRVVLVRTVFRTGSIPQPFVYTGQNRPKTGTLRRHANYSLYNILLVWSILMVYIYIYIEREREGERERSLSLSLSLSIYIYIYICTDMCMYIYIYVYINIHTHIALNHKTLDARRAGWWTSPSCPASSASQWAHLRGGRVLLTEILLPRIARQGTFGTV